MIKKVIFSLIGFLCLIILTGCSSNSSDKQIFETGQQFLSSGQYNSALNTFLKGTQDDPENTDYYVLAADVYSKKGNKDKSVEILNTGFDQTNSAVLAAAIGDVYLSEGELEEAQTWYVKANAIDQNNLESIKGLIKYHSLKNETTEATKLLENFPNENYDSELYIMKSALLFKDPEASKFLTLSATKGNEYVNLTNDLSKAYATYKTDGSVHNLSEIAFVFLNNGWFEIANIPVSEILTQNQFYETGYIYKGLINLNAQLYDEASKNFAKAVEINPENTDAEIFLIQTYYLGDKHDLANQKVETIVNKELTPKQFITLVEILYKNNEVKYIDKLFENNSNLDIPADQRSVLIEALLELGKYQQSELLASSALDGDEILTSPLRARLKSLQGFALFNLNQKQQGLEAMEEAITIDSTQPIVHYYYGKALLDNGEVESAISSFEKSIDVDLEGIVTQKTQDILKEI